MTATPTTIGCLRVLVVAAASDLDSYPTGPHLRLTAQTTGDAIATIERDRPALVVIDWDLRNVDAVQVCRAAVRFPMMSLLMTTERVDTVPAAISAGCRAVLLKPFARNLAAARIGRLSRQMLPGSLSRGRVNGDARGTNRQWLELTCPECRIAGVTSFEFSTHRQLWFACLACSHVWQAPSPDSVRTDSAPLTPDVSRLSRAV